MQRSPWIFSQKIDLLALFVPVWLTWVVAFLLPPEVRQTEVSFTLWIIFVLGIDVSHVWSTIFRTYLDKEERNNHKKVLILAPLIAFGLSLLAAFVSFDFFWRCIAYVAVYHFIKQQYGFMRIYKAKGRDFSKKILSDNLVIYLSMLFPVLYWHLNLDRTFVWFAEGDFIRPQLSAEFLEYFNLIGNTAYLLIILFWLANEVRIYLKDGSVSIGKVLWILTTAGNWYLGIVFFNSDLVFTITNVVAHGLPYFTLIIFYVAKKKSIKKQKINALTVGMYVILGALLLAFIEELSWNQFVYQDAESLSFGEIIPVSPMMQWLALALLAIPQITHYIIDGFIWKNNDKNPYLKPVLFE